MQLNCDWNSSNFRGTYVALREVLTDNVEHQCSCQANVDGNCHTKAFMVNLWSLLPVEMRKMFLWIVWREVALWLSGILRPSHFHDRGSIPSTVNLVNAEQVSPSSPHPREQSDGSTYQGGQITCSAVPASSHEQGIILAEHSYHQYPNNWSIDAVLCCPQYQLRRIDSVLCSPASSQEQNTIFIEHVTTINWRTNAVLPTVPTEMDR